MFQNKILLLLVIKFSLIQDVISFGEIIEENYTGSDINILIESNLKFSMLF